MASQGGPIVNMSISGRTFAVTQDSDPPIDLGGNENDVEMNGDKSARIVSKIVPGKIGPVALVIDHANGDQQFIQEIRDNKELVDVSIELADGSIFYHRGIITDAAEYKPKTGTMDVTSKGEPLTKQ